MKNLIRVFSLLVALNIVSALFYGQTAAQQNGINFQVFYDQLSPYGHWVENPDYGYVWIPEVRSDFTPYLTNGYWVLTDYGWMWQSNYEWGWAPFHYGRWDFSNYYGWFWVPDNHWGPSWVTWRQSAGYYGWAPMRPGVSINVTFGNYNDVHSDRWIFVRDRDFERHDIDRNFIDRRNYSNIIKNSTLINKTYFDDKRRSTYITGPSRDDVQRMTGRTIKPFTVQEIDKPGQSINNDRVQIFRPRVQNDNSGHRPAPSRLTNLRDAEIRQNSKTLKTQQRPRVNIPRKINSIEDPSQERNNNLMNDYKSKGRQPGVNPPKKNSKEQQSKSNPGNDKRENRKH